MTNEPAEAALDFTAPKHRLPEGLVAFDSSI